MEGEPCAICQPAAWNRWRERLLLLGGESPQLARCCDDCRARLKGWYEKGGADESTPRDIRQEHPDHGDLWTAYVDGAKDGQRYPDAPELALNRGADGYAPARDS